MNFFLTALYGALLAATIIRTFYAEWIGLRVAAIALFLDWLASNALWWIAPAVYRTMYASPADLLFGFAFLIAFVLTERMWMAVIAALYVISGVVGVTAYGLGNHYSFDLALNAAFLARLAVVWIASQESQPAQECI